MKTLFVSLLVATALSAQTRPTTLPAHCSPGDLVDSYDHPWACVAKDKWVRFLVFGDKDCTSCPGSKMQMPTGNTGPVPNCGWAFHDNAGKWHCPNETATGSIVACEPCKSGDAPCQSWYTECRKRMALMRHGRTVEPTTVKLDANELTDHTQVSQYICPEGFMLRYLGRKHTSDEGAVCFSPNVTPFQPAVATPY